MDSQEPLYIAGKVPRHEQGNFHFELTRSADGLPFVTRNPSVLPFSENDVHIYKLSADFKTVYLVKSNQPKELDSPATATLDPEQQKLVREAVASGRIDSFTQP